MNSAKQKRFFESIPLAESKKLFSPSHKRRVSPVTQKKVFFSHYVRPKPLAVLNSLARLKLESSLPGQPQLRSIKPCNLTYALSKPAQQALRQEFDDYQAALYSLGPPRDFRKPFKR